ncbi:MAG TPA: hypothetical protein PK530_02065 [Anaerolineales bacterium]|nr:hypothetical protein [Anaerolineales bacterium]
MRLNPKQNRVTPFSTLISTASRGTLMGNRGCLHDERQQIQRPFLGKRWIICLLEFKGRKRPIMTPGHYTELFFLDEATALAAGHRPCAECQRERFNRFRELWASTFDEMPPRPSATVLDAILHEERTSQAHTFCDTVEGLPDGTFVTDDEQTAYLVLKNQILRWTPEGYEGAVGALQYPVRVLTPPSVVEMLARGYPVGIHASAFQGI